MLKIIPSILTDSTTELNDILAVAEGVVDRVQIDIVDGVFASNKTIEPIALESIDTDLNLDFHLMVKEPTAWLEQCVRSGADRVIGQIEMMKSQTDFVGKATELGLSIGLAIDLDTPVEKIDNSIINNLDVILVMSVKAGRGGQEFDPKSLDKIKELNKIRSKDSSPFKICDDGGVSLEWIDDEARLGVDEVVVGRRLFDGDLGVNIKKYMKTAYGNN